MSCVIYICERVSLHNCVVFEKKQTHAHFANLLHILELIVFFSKNYAIWFGDFLSEK
jgi:hypothetical protein